MSPPQEIVAEVLNSRDASVLKEWALSQIFGAERDQIEELPVLDDFQWHCRHKITSERVTIGLPAMLGRAVTVGTMERRGQNVNG